MLREKKWRNTGGKGVNGGLKQIFISNNRHEKLSQNFYNRQIINMAIVNTLKFKGFFVYASKGF